MQLLINHLQKPHINLSGLAKEVDMNVQMLHHAVKGLKPLPEARAWDIVKALSPICLGDWWLTYDEGGFIFIAERKIPDWPIPEPIEHKDEKGGCWFEYPVSMYRTIIADSSDLKEFLS